MSSSENHNLKEQLISDEIKPNRINIKIYYVICFTNILLNIDQGVLPACTNELMEDLHLEEVKFGMLGSLMYIGLIAGSFVAGYIYQKFSCKKVILVNLFLMGFCLSFFTFTKNFYILAVSRIMTGFFQVFLVIFFPVWVDIFGEAKKTIWIAILQVGVPLGTFLGYILTVFSVAVLNWKWGFWLQIILLCPSFIAFCLFEEKDLDTQNSANQNKNDQTNESNSYSLDIYQYEENPILNDLNIIEKSNLLDNSKELEARELTYFGSLTIVMRSKIFLFTMLGISSLYFIVTGIQFWMTDYLRNVLQQEKSIVFLTYSILSITAPTLGALFGGFYVNKQGGYNSPNALKTCVHFGVCAVLCAYPFPFIQFYIVAVVLLWFLLFFGGALMPVLTGIMISSVPSKFRAFGNSTAQIFLNLLGFLPAPFLYGLICGLTGGRDSRWGMVLIMFWSIFGLGTVGYAFLHDKRKRKDKGRREILKNEEIKETNKENKEINSAINKNRQNKSICFTSERKIGEENAKSFEHNKPCETSIARKGSCNINLSFQRSILNSVDFSSIQMLKMNSFKDADEKN